MRNIFILSLLVMSLAALEQKPLYDWAKPNEIQTWDISKGVQTIHITPDVQMVYVCFPKDTVVSNMLDEVEPAFRVTDTRINPQTKKPIASFLVKPGAVAVRIIQNRGETFDVLLDVESFTPCFGTVKYCIKKK
jgi:hypothetical protein